MNTCRLNQQQITQFFKHGFLGPLPRFACDELLDEVRSTVTEVVDTTQCHPIYGRYSVRDWHLVSPCLERLLTHPTLVSALRTLGGDDLALWRSKIFHVPRGGQGTGWHQEWGEFDGEEIGNCKPSLVPAALGHGWWNLTVWIALTDVDSDCAPLRFIRGSQHRQYPKTFVPMTQSEFWHDPFLTCTTVEDIVARAKDCSLVLDIDTSTLFDGFDVTGQSFASVKAYVEAAMSERSAKKTLGVDEQAEDIVVLPMKKGEFVIFTERTMHSSLPNHADHDRLAINIRVTSTDTLIYPRRLAGDVMDGSNLDISHHESVLLCGRDLSGGRNRYRERKGARS